RLFFSAPCSGLVSGSLTVTPADLSVTSSGLTLTSRTGAAVSGLVATFNDAQPDARPNNFTALINWGDGRTSDGIVTATGSGNFAVAGSHTYSAAGSYVVSVTIQAAGGASVTALGSASVADSIANSGE